MTRENLNHIIVPTVSEKKRHNMTVRLHRLEERVLKKFKLKVRSNKCS